MAWPAVIIVNFNSGPHLEASLGSVLRHAPDCRTIVVDNASTDGSDAVADAFSSHVALTRNPTNVGFGCAINQAMAGLSEETVLLLNPDCVLSPRVVETLLAELAHHPECAVAAPAILNEDGTVQGSVRGDPTMLTGLFGRTGLLTTLFPGLAVTRRNIPLGEVGEFAPSREADWVSGACMLIRRRCFDAIGGFDEKYFLYWEDADLCRRLRAAGFTIRYVPSVSVTHAVGVSSRTARALSVREFHRSAFIYYSTHVARSWATRALARIVLACRCRWKLLRS